VVIGQRFAWAHFPKTGGDTTYHLFAVVKGLVVQADEPRSPAKHARFPERAEDVRGKLLVMNTRRLPAWCLSYAHHRIRDTGGRGPVDPRAVAAIVDEIRPDGKLRGFTGDGLFPVDRWLRTEHLVDDFLDFAASVGNVSGRARRRAIAIAPANTNRYERSWERWFTPAQLGELYERNPLWAAVERAVYGDLVTL
jgi:hypothetical protein